MSKKLTRRQRRDGKRKYKREQEKDWYADAVANYNHAHERTNMRYLKEIARLLWTEFLLPVSVAFMFICGAVAVVTVLFNLLKK